MRILLALTTTILLSQGSTQAYAWGDQGHEVVAAIAAHFLEPSVKAKIEAMLAADTDTLTAHDMPHEATWADRYRDSDRKTTKAHYNSTHLWHFVDIETAGPKAGDAEAACFRVPQIPEGVPASEGPARDCTFNKIDEFAAELSSPGTPPGEKLLALKFLLHLVGDLHQPLHASDNHNSGGNAVRVKAEGIRAGNLHHYWDTEFVQGLNKHASPSNFEPLADQLLKGISKKEAAAWARGRPMEWALEAFAIIKEDPFMGLPKGALKANHPMSDAYVAASTKQVGEQLQKAGVRLAFILNAALH